ncbi:MAG: hypothetical protein P8K08_19875 [Fuerstiella sp.]|nr:hypothetical protein [Fuerstiella sp.]
MSLWITKYFRRRQQRRVGPYGWRLLLVPAGRVILLLMCCFPSARARDAEAERSERLFLQQLTERQLFALAEQHCRQQIARSPTTDQQAEWQQRLCQTLQEHAWFTPAADREGLLNQSLTELTEFLNDNVASPVRQFGLRLQQARILGQSIRMSICLSEAGHLFGHDLGSATEQKSVQIAVAPILITVANRAIAITEALMEQLERMRSDLPPDNARELQGAARLVLAELYSLKGQLLSGAKQIAIDAEKTFDDAEGVLKLIRRSVATHETKLTASWLSAEIALRTGDNAQFNLKISSGTPSSGPDRPIALLQIRALLLQGECSDALQLLSKPGAVSALARQQLAWLKLESLLGRFELASELEDSALLMEASGAFKTAYGQLRPILQGVFAECVERTVQRFHLVTEVGAEIADVVEQIESVHADGDIAAALQLIDVALSRLSGQRRQRPRAALLLRAGELLIEKRKWTEARSRLDGSLMIYERLGESTRQAAADLLRVFVLAQLSVQTTSQIQTVTSEEYVAAIENHLVRFSDQSTARRARQWLLRQVRSQDPLRAARLVLSMTDDAKTATRQLELLQDCGRLLAASGTMGHDAESAEVLALFREHVDQLAAGSDTLDEIALASLQLWVLSAMVAEQPPMRVDWINVNTRLNAIHSQLPRSHLLQDKELFLQFSVLEALTAARTVSTRARMDTAAQNLLTLKGRNLSTCLRSLYSQLKGSRASVGDVWLAGTTESLVRHWLAEKKRPLTAKTVLFALPIVVCTNRLTGQQQLQNQILQDDSIQTLDNSVLISIAELLAEEGTKQSTASFSPGVRRFWLMIVESSSSGSDVWLEASYQLARTSAQQQKPGEARRRLGVVQALYPDWGSVDRLRRAQELGTQLRD